MGKPRTAVYPGTFDPMTLGHFDLIKRAAKLYDRLIVAVAATSKKQGALFDAAERLDMIREDVALVGLENVEVKTLDGLLVDFCRKENVSVVTRGVRVYSDFEYEFQMALTNHKLNPYAETVFLNTAAENMYLSSSMVKQIARFGGDISSFIPREIYAQVRDRLCKNPLGGTDK